MGHAHYSKITIAGHPIHPMIVGFPVAFYTAGVVTMIVYGAGGSGYWLQTSVYLLIAGVVMALVAAIFGLLDLFIGVPAQTAARKTGVAHMGLNLLGTIVFAGAAAMLWYRWRTQVHPAIALPLVLGLIALGSTIGAGSLGWKLVQTHHVGVDEGTREVPMSELDTAHRRV
ncbi:MAG: DUF2231 domain-containing protein [Kofleriaceae bacterium]|nr:DUF2231 domain-containing protein [Kofleriaceae bacterium]